VSQIDVTIIFSEIAMPSRHRIEYRGAALPESLAAEALAQFDAGRCKPPRFTTPHQVSGTATTAFHPLFSNRLILILIC
jgi:hypothetical protein